MHVLEDARSEIIKRLPHDRSDFLTVQALSQLPDVELYIIFFNWSARLIPAHARNVHFSRDYLSRSKSTELEMKAAKIFEKIECGANINPHLSRRITSGFVMPEPHSGPYRLKNRTDLDLLLNDWGIHHLHLSGEVENDGFVERDGPLLFVIFTPSDAFVLDLYPDHGSWTDQHLVEIVIRNWPSEGLFLQLNGALGLQHAISGAERKQLREAGIDCPIEVDGKVYVSATKGISTAGTSGEAALRGQRLYRSLMDIDKTTKENPDYLKLTFLSLGLPCPDICQFRLLLLNGPAGFHFIIRESNSGAFIGVND